MAAIFTIKFWTVLWYLAMWVDQNLILSMYPDVNVFLQIFANPGEHDAKCEYDHHQPLFIWDYHYSGAE